MEEALAEFAQSENDNFSRNYILDKFGSHEDALIRNHTNQAHAEKHQLSNMFTKNKSFEKKEETILPLILTSLNVLKNGIIDMQLKSLMDELQSLDKDKTDRERELHYRIGEILRMRSRMAKNIGDRILSPVSLKSSGK